jgi:hypothetical protein
LSSLFSKAEKKADEIVNDVKDYATDIVSSVTKETPGTFENNTYLSHKKKFKIEFNKDNTVKNITINNEKYTIPN